MERASDSTQALPKLYADARMFSSVFALPSAYLFASNLLNFLLIFRLIFWSWL